MKKRKADVPSWTTASFWGMLSFQWNKIKADRRIAVLWAVEMILAVMIGAAIAIYLDPEWNVVPFPYNIIAFGLMVGVAIMIHRRTRPFRLAHKIKAKKASI